MYLTKKNNFQHSSTNTLHHVFSCFGEYSKLHVITFYAQTIYFKFHVTYLHNVITIEQYFDCSIKIFFFL